jgi:hypothetical protein
LALILLFLAEKSSGLPEEKRITINIGRQMEKLYLGLNQDHEGLLHIKENIPDSAIFDIL